MKTTKTVRVCFVCLGNICRSPLAHGVFEALVDRQGLAGKILTDSAGTGAWHVGEPADSRMSETAMKKGVILNSRARQFTPGDFKRFDLVIAMDRINLDSLRSICPTGEAGEKLKLFRSFDPVKGNGLDVPDPYYGGANGFDTVFHIVNRTCPNILDYVKKRFSLSP
ncbi:MAG: low molecular weight protein-tyrosine-phosphatase [Nitrospinales bacterium]